jgi:hypothetical protein
MSNRSTTLRGLGHGHGPILLAILATAFMLVAPAALAGGFLEAGGGNEKSNEAPTWAVPAARKPVEGEGTEALAAELHNAELRVQEALQNAETAAYQLKRARTRSYPRGQALEDLKRQDQETRRERTAAANEFSALVERARRAGVPMGTLSRYMDLDDRIQKERAASGAN